MNARVSVEKRPKKATDERKVPTVMKKVKIHQPIENHQLIEQTGQLCEGGSTHQIVPERIVEFRFTGVGTSDIKERDKNTRKTDPEATVRTERKLTKRIPTRKLPHPRHKLRQSTIRKRYHQLPSRADKKTIGHIPSPMTMFGVATLRAWTLIKLSTKVVRAKPQRPRGAGLANCLNKRL